MKLEFLEKKGDVSFYRLDSNQKIYVSFSFDENTMVPIVDEDKCLYFINNIGNLKIRFDQTGKLGFVVYDKEDTYLIKNEWDYDKVLEKLDVLLEEKKKPLDSQIKETEATRVAPSCTREASDLVR